MTSPLTEGLLGPLGSAASSDSFRESSKSDTTAPFSTVDDLVEEAVSAELKRGRLFRYDCDEAEGSTVSQLEAEFAELTGRRYAIAVNSCSSAIFMALMAGGVKPGDRVLLPAFTFTAVPSAVVHAGAQPVLVEVTGDYVIDCDDLELQIENSGARWLLLSHMRGRPADLDRVTEICRARDVTLIEDCAHSLGVLWNDIPTGRFGQSAAFSAQSYKLIDAGEGGFLVTDDSDVAVRAILMSGAYEGNWRKHFHTEPLASEIRRLQPTMPAYNFRMSNLSAAALLPQLSQVESRVAHYNALYDTVTRILEESSRIQLPEFLPAVRPAADSLQFRVVGLSKDQLRRFSDQVASRGTRMSVLGLSEDNARCFWNWEYFSRDEDCPVTRGLLESTVDVRLRPTMTLDAAVELARTIVSVVDSL